jgi:hypothetical protein
LARQILINWYSGSSNSTLIVKSSPPAFEETRAISPVIQTPGATQEEAIPNGGPCQKTGCTNLRTVKARGSSFKVHCSICIDAALIPRKPTAGGRRQPKQTKRARDNDDIPQEGQRTKAARIQKRATTAAKKVTDRSVEKHMAELSGESFTVEDDEGSA